MKDTILLVDDEALVLAALTRALIDAPYEVLTASSGSQALKIIESTKIKVIVSDECMVGMQGSELLEEVRRRSPHTIRILLTGHGTLEAAVKAVNELGVYRYFTKPWDDAQLRFALLSALEMYNLKDENRRLVETVKSQAMEIKVLEKRYPGISRVERDGDGVFVLPDIPEEDLSSIIEECELEMLKK